MADAPLTPQQQIAILAEALAASRSALGEVRRVLHAENEKPGGAIRDTIWRSGAETLFDYIDAALDGPTPSPPVAAVPATPVWDGKLPEALQRKLNALRLECAPAIVSDVEHEVRSVFEGMHTSLATVKRMYAAARDRLEAAEPQVDPFAQPQPQPAQPLTGAAETITVITAPCDGYRWIAKDAAEVAHFSLPGQGHKIEVYAITAPSTPTPEVAP